MHHPNFVPRPLVQSPVSDVVPHSYKIIQRNQRCVNCGSEHEYTEVYAYTNLRSMTYTGKYTRVSHRITQPSEIQYNLPITRESLSVHPVPFCHDCYATASLSHLPLPPAPAPSPRVGPSWAGQSAGKPKPSSANKTTKPTLDDLSLDF